MSEVAAFRSILPQITAENIEAVETRMLQLPQVACDVIHRFGPGLYIREVFIPAGTFAIGHYQKYEHMNVFLKGKVLIVNEDGSTEELTAPMSFVGKPGRKIGYILEDMYWQNIYATDEKNIEVLEGLFFDRSDAFIDRTVHKRAMDAIARQIDRDDFALMLSEAGISAEQAEAQSQNADDYEEIALGAFKFTVQPSPISGKGLFATASLEEGEIIAPARLMGKRTQAGRLTNHSATPNAMMAHNPLGDIYLVASRSISGYEGGEPSEEITIDYRQAIAECREASKVILCQQSPPPL